MLEIDGLSDNEYAANNINLSNINTTLKLVPKLNLYQIYLLRKELIQDDKLSKQISKRINTVANCGNEDIINISNENQELTMLTLSSNFLVGWLPYIFPLVIMAYIIKLLGIAIDYFKKLDWLPFLRIHEIEQRIPSGMNINYT